MDPAKLIQGYEKIMRTIYSPREYYQRALDSMRRTAQQFAEPQHYKLISSLTSFTRVMLKLGVLDSERREFWRFLTQTLLKHRNKLAESLRPGSDGLSFPQVE